MNYQETLQYLYAELPMFQRVGASAYKKDLHNTIQLCQALGNPQQRFKSVHVGGTNGKGSSSHFLAAILRSQGYKTGLYTSPHLKSFTERIRIDGKEVGQDFVVAFVEKVKPLIETLKPSFFEITVAMAFDFFAEQKVDVAVIEVGLGGRLDSTNIIQPLVSLITNIGYDHKDILGETLEEIAREKAGIIKPGSPVVISEKQPEISQVFVAKANEMKSPIIFAEDQFRIEWKKEKQSFAVQQQRNILFPLLKSELRGGYQRKNLAGVLATIDVLRELGYRIDKHAVSTGIENAVTMTGLKGRWQKLNDQPLTYCDVAHNVEGMKEVLAMIEELKFNQLHFVLGMVRDKDIRSMLSILPKSAIYYFCKADIPRGLDVQQLALMAADYELKGETCISVADAIRLARKSAHPDDMIFIGGSTFVVAEVEDL